ncbi:protein-tyrosine-phosphatase [Paramagnetospirillum kuznetsovii]|uniref:Protein-tyrosine-phosphatase n=1 Tax=Paramagnetospirillum kuznetsovii TaxID=2053833 RepID=A0A364P0X9_9PROT|nr:dual specificity protein phosphatase family protein [Paramagnetospirillum kuznetsovii]RAU22963.1 protein-tyrosine-phosphatase [Paramagnetospirillum kuznetsovii]
MPSLLPFPLTICGVDELPDHAGRGVSHVLTILDPGTPDPEHFGEFGPHKRTRWDFHDIVNTQDGQQHPTEHNVRAILDYGTALQDEPVNHLLIHCFMGISRSTATAVILMAQANPGREAEAFEHLRDIRPYSWPNSRMIAMADSLLDRKGALVAAMKDHHKTMARLRPDMMPYLRTSERAAEVPEEE